MNLNTSTHADDFLSDFFSTAPELTPATPEDLAAMMQAQSDYNADIRAYESAQTELERRALRLSLCGKRRTRYISAETGKLVAGTYSCGLWRNKECPRCSANREQYTRSRAHAAVLDARHADDSHLLHMLKCDKHTANCFTRKLGRKLYLRIPQQDGSEILLIDGETRNSVPITYDELSELDWENIVNTPEGRNMSGDLGKPPDDDQVGTIKVKTRSVVVNATPQQEIKAWDRAVKETQHLQPENSDDLAATLEIAMEIRIKKYIKHLRALGGTVLPKSSRVINQTCRISCILWGGVTEKTAPLTAEQLSEIPF